MASRRLLDAAKFLSASRAVAGQHLRLRKEQWDLYTRTSSLARAVKSQTDRVTLTLGAARELAKRFDDRPQQWGDDPRSHASHDPGAAGGSGEDPPPAATSDPTTTPPSPLRARQLQRGAESQIPSASASSQGDGDGEGAGEVFSERGRSVTAELSSLPRVKLPKNAADAGEGAAGGMSLDGLDVNQEVFPAPPPEGVDTDVFASPRVARMLGGRGAGEGEMRNPYAGRERVRGKPLPEMVEARDGGTRRDIGESEGADAEVQELAASMERDARSQVMAQNQNQVATADLEQARTYEMRESRVPSSRFGRLWQYGGLATGMAFGAVGEGFRRLAGGGKGGSVMMSEGNINRLVAKLSRMRGAALKLGQMMSFQDSNFLPPTINAVLQRVQDSADYMPASQRDKVLMRNLGQDWRDLFSNFEEKPFAAASIGQVHKARLKSNGQDVAVKIQYPGVRNSIDSDLNNLSLLLTASQLLPRGLYLEKTIANARTELAWECDYEREARAGIRFKDELLGDERDFFTVPTVFLEASGPDVLTAEFLHGTAVTKIRDLTQDERDWIGTQILRISWRELMEWKFMQTDPNWTNFLYNRETKKLELLDFGASRDFSDEFVEPYVELLIAASRGDRDACRDRSIELGYLTGQESRSMLNAHIDSIMVLAEPFKTTAPDVYDFENQTITDRVRANIGLMLRERLAPPPEETYSLHRKLSGAFLLCARLKSKIKTKQMFQRAVDVWNGREKKVEAP